MSQRALVSLVVVPVKWHYSNLSFVGYNTVWEPLFDLTNPMRTFAYAISALAVICFLFFPEPRLAVIGALMLQTCAYIVIAGRSALDGYVLVGISLVMFGSLPADHPFIVNDFYFSVRWWLIGIGAVVIALSLIGLLRKRRLRMSP